MTWTKSISIFDNVYLHDYLAKIYLNAQEAGQYVENLTTDLYIFTCEKSHVLVTYQILAY